MSMEQTRTDQMRHMCKGMIDPVVRGLARIGVTPNMLTVLGLLIHLPVAWLIVQGQFRWAAVVGLLSMFDALDGSLARLNPDHNPKGFGAFLDSTLDRIAEILIWGAFSIWFYTQGELLYVALSAVVLGGALMVSYTRARAEALGLTCKVGLFTRIERYIVQFLFGLLNLPYALVIILAIGTWITVAQRITTVWKQTKQERSKDVKK